MGAHLLECSGNNNPANFGLMSVAEVGRRAARRRRRHAPAVTEATAVLVSGVDPDQPSTTSIRGASWVFPLSSLDSVGAFLAVRVNGEPLPLDHGKPVRLVVPGWYGCSWIKWVDEIRLVDASEPATSQMREFAAARTRPPSTISRLPMRRRRFRPRPPRFVSRSARAPPASSTASSASSGVARAWSTGSRSASATGSRGSRSTSALPRSPRRPGRCGATAGSLPAPGVYSIALRVPDASVPQRRLDSGYYVRQVTVDESNRGALPLGLP